MSKMRKMLAFAVMAMFTLALCAFLAGCSGGSGLSEGVPEWADEAAVVQDAQAVIEDFSARDYDSVAAKGQTVGLTADQLQGAGDAVLDALGALSGFGDSACMTGADGAGAEFVTVVQMADYENGTAQYTISFYEDGSLAGFYVK